MLGGVSGHGVQWLGLLDQPPGQLAVFPGSRSEFPADHRCQRGDSDWVGQPGQTETGPVGDDQDTRTNRACQQCIGQPAGFHRTSLPPGTRRGCEPQLTDTGSGTVGAMPARTWPDTTD